jgi:hypothetical protein
LVVILGIGFYFSDLRVRLIDIPILDSRKQPIVQSISMVSTNDQLLKEQHYPLRQLPWCVWGNDSWTYKSNRTWTEITQAYDQAFAGWQKIIYSDSRTGIEYRTDYFYVIIELQGVATSGSQYDVYLTTDYPSPDPRCGE